MSNLVFLRHTAPKGVAEVPAAAGPNGIMSFRADVRRLNVKPQQATLPWTLPGTSRTKCPEFAKREVSVPAKPDNPFRFGME